VRRGGRPSRRALRCLAPGGPVHAAAGASLYLPGAGSRPLVPSGRKIRGLGAHNGVRAVLGALRLAVSGCGRQVAPGLVVLGVRDALRAVADDVVRVVVAVGGAPVVHVLELPVCPIRVLLANEAAAEVALVVSIDSAPSGAREVALGRLAPLGGVGADEVGFAPDASVVVLALRVRVLARAVEDAPQVQGLAVLSGQDRAAIFLERLLDAGNTVRGRLPALEGNGGLGLARQNQNEGAGLLLS